MTSEQSQNMTQTVIGSDGGAIQTENEPIQTGTLMVEGENQVQHGSNDGRRLATFPVDLWQKLRDRVPKDSSEFPIVIQPESEIPMTDIKWMKEAFIFNGQHHFQPFPKATSSTETEATEQLDLQEDLEHTKDKS